MLVLVLLPVLRLATSGSSAPSGPAEEGHGPGAARRAAGERARPHFDLAPPARETARRRRGRRSSEASARCRGRVWGRVAAVACTSRKTSTRTPLRRRPDSRASRRRAPCSSSAPPAVESWTRTVVDTRTLDLARVSGPRGLRALVRRLAGRARTSRRAVGALQCLCAPKKRGVRTRDRTRGLRRRRGAARRAVVGSSDGRRQEGRYPRPWRANGTGVEPRRRERRRAASAVPRSDDRPDGVRWEASYSAARPAEGRPPPAHRAAPRDGRARRRQRRAAAHLRGCPAGGGEDGRGAADALLERRGRPRISARDGARRGRRHGAAAEAGARGLPVAVRPDRRVSTAAARASIRVRNAAAAQAPVAAARAAAGRRAAGAAAAAVSFAAATVGDFRLTSTTCTLEPDEERRRSTQRRPAPEAGAEERRGRRRGRVGRLMSDAAGPRRRWPSYGRPQSAAAGGAGPP